jgi:hypothetical protein
MKAEKINYSEVEEFAKTEGLKDIEKFVVDLSNNATPFTIWQKDDQGRRLMVRVHFDHMNPVEPEIRVLPENVESDLTIFDKQKSLFIFTDDKASVGEMRIIYGSKRHLIVLPPHVLHRKVKRYIPQVSTQTENKMVTFSKNSVVYEYPIVDISETGLAFIVPPSKAKVFQYIKDPIQLMKILDFKLHESMVAYSVYLTKLPDHTWFRVGVCFQHPIEIKDLEENNSRRKVVTDFSAYDET